MKIAHVLTYVSRDGAYGGPLAVMVAQASELARRGHEVEIFAGWDGAAELEVPGVTVRLFEVRRLLGRGFSTMVAPRLARELRRRRREFDVVHVHLGRDLIALPAALAVGGRGGRPRLFVQTHGMVKPDGRRSAQLVDVAVRLVLRRSTASFALNSVDAERITTVARGAVDVVDLPNGVPEQTTPPSADQGSTPEFLFLARLQARKNVMTFAQAAKMLVDDGVDARFTVVGPDEGDLPALLAFIDEHGLDHHLTYGGSVPPGAGPERLSQADVYVLPSLDEPFPMTVLEALSVGRPCIIASSCHIAEDLERGGGVLLFDGSVAGLAASMARLAGDSTLRAERGARALEDVRTNYSSAAVVDRLLTHYDGDLPLTDAAPLTAGSHA